MKIYSFLPSAVILAAAAAFGLTHTATVAPGGLIKASLPAVYYVGVDNKRYVFPNDKVYFSWYADFSGVNKVTDAELAAYPIGGNVTYRPGMRLVKIQSDPKVYAVDVGGKLRWVKTEAAAVALFGANWSKQVDDISDSFFVNYALGSDISSASDFNPGNAKGVSSSIDVDKNLSAVPAVNTNTNTNTNVNVPVSTSACMPECSLGDSCNASGTCQTVTTNSALKIAAFIVDTANVCFVGDACTGGACCTVAGNSFADNANLKAVRPSDKYLYADKQQLCGSASLSAMDRDRINQELSTFSNEVSARTGNRMSVGVNEQRISGDYTMSRVAGTCSWWMSPDDIRGPLVGQVDSSVDAVFVESTGGFSFGQVNEPGVTTVDQMSGLAGAGYTYVAKEWEANTSGAPDPSAFVTAFTNQMNSSVELGITKPNMSFIGNHCRDARRDFDETGVDCGGVGCNACAY